MIHDQIVKRGRYVASNLAFNAKYGVLTEDKPLLTQFLEGAVSAGGTGEASDVVGAMIRDAKGETLAQIGKAIREPAEGARRQARGARSRHHRGRAGAAVPRAGHHLRDGSGGRRGARRPRRRAAPRP